MKHNPAENYGIVISNAQHIRPGTLLRRWFNAMEIFLAVK